MNHKTAKAAGMTRVRVNMLQKEEKKVREVEEKGEETRGTNARFLRSGRFPLIAPSVSEILNDVSMEI